MKVLASFTIANLNPRKEAAGDESGKLALDIKLTALLPHSACVSFFGTETSFDKLLGDLWDGNGDMTTTDLKKLSLNSQIVGGKATLTAEFSGTEIFEGCKLNKITLEPQAGRMVDVSMRLQVYPSSTQLSRLGEWLESEVMVLAERGTSDMFEGDVGKPVKPKKSKGKTEDQLPLH